MKARIPTHREFIIQMEDGYDKKDDCWQALQVIMDDYKKEGKSIYTASFIEDNEAKVKALQDTFAFTYTVEERK